MKFSRDLIIFIMLTFGQVSCGFGSKRSKSLTSSDQTLAESQSDIGSLRTSFDDEGNEITDPLPETEDEKIERRRRKLRDQNEFDEREKENFAIKSILDFFAPDPPGIRPKITVFETPGSDSEAIEYMEVMAPYMSMSKEERIAKIREVSSFVPENDIFQRGSKPSEIIGGLLNATLQEDMNKDSFVTDVFAEEKKIPTNISESSQNGYHGRGKIGTGSAVKLIANAEVEAGLEYRTTESTTESRVNTEYVIKVTIRVKNTDGADIERNFSLERAIRTVFIGKAIKPVKRDLRQRNRLRFGGESSFLGSDSSCEAASCQYSLVEPASLEGVFLLQNGDLQESRAGRFIDSDSDRKINAVTSYSTFDLMQSKKTGDFVVMTSDVVAAYDFVDEYFPSMMRQYTELMESKWAQLNSKTSEIKKTIKDAIVIIETLPIDVEKLGKVTDQATMLRNTVCQESFVEQLEDIKSNYSAVQKLVGSFDHHASWLDSLEDFDVLMVLKEEMASKARRFREIDRHTSLGCNQLTNLAVTLALKLEEKKLRDYLGYSENAENRILDLIKKSKRKMLASTEIALSKKKATAAAIDLNQSTDENLYSEGLLNRKLALELLASETVKINTSRNLDANQKANLIDNISRVLNTPIEYFDENVVDYGIPVFVYSRAEEVNLQLESLYYRLVNKSGVERNRLIVRWYEIAEVNQVTVELACANVETAFNYSCWRLNIPTSSSDEKWLDFDKRLQKIENAIEAFNLVL